MTQIDANENQLEIALRLAADEPAHRPDFYKALLDSTVFILGHSDSSGLGERMLEAGKKVSIQNWTHADGSPVIPFFSSLNSLQKAIEEEVAYMALPAKSLFEMTRGATLVLNPKLAYGKEFFPNEIDALLSEGVNRLPEQRITKKATQVLLGQPANYPEKMVDSLVTLFSKRGNVKAAYLTLMHDPSQDEKPHLVVGIEAEGDVESVIREAGVVAGDISPNNEPVDLYRVARDDKGLSEYFLREVQPFYERRWGSKIKSFLGIGRA